MTRSIERWFRRIPAHLAAATLVVVPAVHPPCDSAQRRAAGYAGVLLVPEPTGNPEAVDSILFSHRDRRAARVRIRYADGHTERSLDSVRVSRAHDVRTARQSSPA